MLHHLIPVLFAALLMAIPSQAAEVCFQNSFDAGKAPGWDGPGLFEDAPGRGQVLHISQSAPADKARSVMTIPIPIEKVRGSHVFFGADVRAKAVSAKPISWAGIKVMLVVETPSGKQYPQADISVGDMDWTRYSFSTPVPLDATAASIVLGLEFVSGDVWFDNAQISLRKKITQTPAADPAKPIYRGHDLPRLRGPRSPIRSARRISLSSPTNGTATSFAGSLPGLAGSPPPSNRSMPGLRTNWSNSTRR